MNHEVNSKTWTAIGRRKRSQAYVRFMPKKVMKKANTYINEKTAGNYLQNNPYYLRLLEMPLIKAGIKNIHDIYIKTETDTELATKQHISSMSDYFTKTEINAQSLATLNNLAFKLSIYAMADYYI